MISELTQNNDYLIESQVTSGEEGTRERLEVRVSNPANVSMHISLENLPL